MVNLSISRNFRHKDGVEVDIVVERGSRAVAGVEVKAAATVTRTDFQGLRKACERRRGPVCARRGAP